MYPELLQIGSFTLRSYSLITEIGIVIGVYAGYRAAKRQGVPSEAFIDLALWAVLLGIVGSRAWYVVVNWNVEHYAQEPLRVFASWEGGLIFQGAIAGGVVGLFLGIRRTGLPFLQVADWGAVGLVLGHAVGRWACFFNGCCYGTETDLPWGVRFPFQDHPVQPTMIYESLANFAIFGFLWQVERRKPVHGYTLSLYLILYSTVRFLDEFTRGDPADMLFNLRLAQVVSLGTLLVGLALFVYVKRQLHTRETRWAGLPAPVDTLPEDD